MKKCILVSDSFKGTLKSIEICELARSAFKNIMPECELVTIPVADGGEGTAECFIYALGFEAVTVSVHGPFGEKVDAVYARKNDTAIIEMAAAAGLPLVGENKNPAIAGTFGVGELILDAIQNGCRRIVLGLGGSAGNDGGCGCASALGIKFRDADGKVFVPVGETLDKIAHIDISDAKKLLEGIEIKVMCDVTNPLYGKNGAAYIFAPQKGADPDTVEKLDGKLRAFSDAIIKSCGVDVSQMAGVGAAGGMGAGCVALLGAKLCSGVDTILDAVGFDEALKGSDLLISGEGKLDSQSLEGKLISGVLRRTGAAGVPVVILSGIIDDSIGDIHAEGVEAVFCTNRSAKSFGEVKKSCRQDYLSALEDILRLIKMSEKFSQA